MNAQQINSIPERPGLSELVPIFKKEIAERMRVLSVHKKKGEIIPLVLHDSFVYQNDAHHDGHLDVFGDDSHLVACLDRHPLLEKSVF